MALYSITLEHQLMEQLEQIASEQAVKPDELVENAVRAYLRQAERKKIQAEAAAFRAMHARLTETHMGKYVAIHNRQIVDDDDDFQSLHSRIRQRFGRQPILLRRVTAESEREWVFRSPRFERG